MFLFSKNIKLLKSDSKVYLCLSIKNNVVISWAENRYIRTIFEGLCDTEDWSNDAENSALHHRNK